MGLIMKGSSRMSNGIRTCVLHIVKQTIHCGVLDTRGYYTVSGIGTCVADQRGYNTNLHIHYGIIYEVLHSWTCVADQGVYAQHPLPGN